MGRNFLFIVEGEKTEPCILKAVLERWGYNAIKTKRILELQEFNHSFDLSFDETKLTNAKDNVVIAQAPRNRLHDLVVLYKKHHIDLDKLFGAGENILFSGIFVIFDVDHTNASDLKEAFAFHCDETSSGLLLVSSPCIEIISEPKRKDTLSVCHLGEYKSTRNVHCHNVHKKDVTQYIADNFEALALEFLEKNLRDFKEPNVMEHPRLVIEAINKHNIRNVESVVYRYFTTVVYVALAYISGATKEIDNYCIVKDLLEKKF